MITHENATAVSTVASGNCLLGGNSPDDTPDHRTFQVAKLAATFRLSITTAGAVAALAFGGAK